MINFPLLICVIFQETFIEGEQAEKKVCKNVHAERYLSIFYMNCYGDLASCPVRNGNRYKFTIIFRNKYIS